MLLLLKKSALKRLCKRLFHNRQALVSDFLRDGERRKNADDVPLRQIQHHAVFQRLHVDFRGRVRVADLKRQQQPFAAHVRDNCRVTPLPAAQPRKNLLAERGDMRGDVMFQQI